MQNEKEKQYEFGKPERPEQEESDYREAPGYIVEMAENLIKSDHQHLKPARITYLMKDGTIKYRGKEVPGKVHKVHDREKVEMKKDFIVVISEEKWEQAEEQGKEEAALDWILCFMGGMQGDWSKKDPDFSGFYKNVDRFGMWDRSLKTLEKKMKQTSISVDTPQPEPEPSAEEMYQR